MKGYTLVVGGALLLHGCAVSSAHEGVEIFNPAVAAAFSDFDETMTASRAPIRFEDGTRASSCETYLAARRDTKVEETVHNKTISQEYLICDTLAALAAAVEPRTEPPLTMSYGEALLTRLDLGSFPSSLHPAAEQYPLLADLASVSRIRLEETSVFLEQDDWHFQLEVVARGDVNRDGYEDWLVWLTDEALNSSYRDYTLLVIDRVTEEGTLRAEVFR